MQGAKNFLKRIGRAAWHALQSWFRHNAQRKGASIAFYAIFALAPFLLLVVALAGLVFGEDAARGYVVGQLSGLVGRQSAETLQTLLAAAWTHQKDGIVALVSGAVTLLIGVTGVFVELSSAINETWDLKAEHSWTAALRTRIAALALVVGFGFLVIISLGLSAALNALGQWLLDFSDTLVIAVQAANFVISFGVMLAAFNALFRGLTWPHKTARMTWSSALATTVLFVIGKELIALYLGRSSTTSPYGAAGSFVALVLWVYYTSQIMLLGAEFGHTFAATGAKGRGDARGEPASRVHPI